jgi:hypothetical protein
MIFYILHSSFFIEFCKAKFLWASRFGRCAPSHQRCDLVRAASRRAIRYITRIVASRLLRVVSLLSLSHCALRAQLKMKNFKST